MEPIRSQPFTVRPTRLAWFFAEQYVRMFWWMLIGIPLGGLVVLLLVPGNIAKYIGIVCLVWPLSIPARAALVTRKLAKKLLRPTVAEFKEDGVYYYSDGKPAMRLLWSNLRSVDERKGFLIFTTHKLGVSVVPLNSLSQEQHAAIQVPKS